MRVVQYKSKLTEAQRVVLEKEYCVNYPQLDRKMTSPEKVARFATDFLRIHERPEEYLYMLCMNNKLELTGVFELSHGNVNSSVVGIREMFQKALLANAVNVIVLHNHPSGDPTPSREDVLVTERMMDAGKLLGIGVLDHIVIGSYARFVSLKEKGYMKEAN